MNGTISRLGAKSAKRLAAFRKAPGWAGCRYHVEPLTGHDVALTFGPHAHRGGLRVAVAAYPLSLRAAGDPMPAAMASDLLYERGPGLYPAARRGALPGHRELLLAAVARGDDALSADIVALTGRRDRPARHRAAGTDAPDNTGAETASC